MLFKIFTRIILYLLFFKFLNLIERRIIVSKNKEKNLERKLGKYQYIYIYWKLVKTESLLTKYYVSRDKIIISLEIRKITNKISRKTFQNLYLESKRNITCFEREGKRESVIWLILFIRCWRERLICQPDRHWRFFNTSRRTSTTLEVVTALRQWFYY